MVWATEHRQLIGDVENDFNTNQKEKKNVKYAILPGKTTKFLHKTKNVPYFLSVYLVLVLP